MSGVVKETGFRAFVRTQRLLVGVVSVVAAVALLAGLVVVPVHSVTKQLTFAAGTTATTELVVSQPAWVTIHFGHASGMMGGSGMAYWMGGPSGMMFNHSMMGDVDTYSFWSWGGTYRCGAGYAGPGSGMMSVWVNASWGVL